MILIDLGGSWCTKFVNSMKKYAKVKKKKLKEYKIVQSVQKRAKVCKTLQKSEITKSASFIARRARIDSSEGHSSRQG